MNGIDLLHLRYAGTAMRFLFSTYDVCPGVAVSLINSEGYDHFDIRLRRNEVLVRRVIVEYQHKPERWQLANLQSNDAPPHKLIPELESMFTFSAPQGEMLFETIRSMIAPVGL